MPLFLPDLHIFYYRAHNQPGPLGMIDMREVKGAGALERPNLSNAFDIVTDARTFVLVRRGAGDLCTRVLICIHCPAASRQRRRPGQVD